VNIKEQVEDRAPQFGLAPNLEGRFATVPLGLEKSGVSYQRFAPNFRLPFGHKQTEQEELYVVVSGSGRIKLDDEIVEIERSDAIRISPDVVRCLEGGPEGIEVLAVSPRRTDDRGEMLPDWWSD
jgi:mannose-6-phosphate isomerase-like protein (cupin superfamily)